MVQLEIKKKIELDEDGFLLNWEEWDEEVAKALAADERWTGTKIELTNEHWVAIGFLRKRFEEKGECPPVKKILEEIARKLGEEKATKSYLYKLFPQGLAKDAVRIAGLPKRCSASLHAIG